MSKLAIRRSCDQLVDGTVNLQRARNQPVQRTVVVIEPAWTGHHPLYFKRFCSAIAELDCRVVGICPDPGEVMSIHCLRWSSPTFSFRPRRISGPLTMRAQHWWLPRRLRALEQEIGEKIDLVFFSCLFDHFLQRHPTAFGWDWAGLYLHVSGYRIPGDSDAHPLNRFRRLSSQRSSSRLRGLAVLDEDAVDFVTDVSGCTNVVAFPDFSTCDLSDDSDVANRLSRFAAGRKVIGIAGHLQPSKGTVTLAEAAIRSHQEGRTEVFAFVGELWWELFDEDDREILRRAFAFDNVFTHLDRIPSEADFNTVLARFDVIYAGYNDFPHSSNMPAKAAGLRRPMIVSDGYLLGDRVTRFRLGRTIPQRNVDALLIAIRETLSDGERDTFEGGARDYLEVHSVVRLRAAMDRLLSSIWGNDHRQQA